MRRHDKRTGMRDCSDCPRLAAHRNVVKALYPDYHCRPVAPWGSPRARLRDVRITNAVRCLPPENRPTMSELHTCSAYLANELADLWSPLMRQPRCVLALGRIAHSAVALAGGWTLPDFRHGQTVALAPKLLLIESYHPSRQNTNTGRLTVDMLDAVLTRARRHLDAWPA